MIVRRCSQGHLIRIHRNTTKGAIRTKTYSDGTSETLAYPSSYNYFVYVDGEIIKKTNSFKIAEELYVKECEKKHDNGHGRLIIGKHQLIGAISTSQSDYPTMDNTKSKIKDFYDKRGIKYGSNETKSQLLSRIKFIPGPNNLKQIEK